MTKKWHIYQPTTINQNEVSRRIVVQGPKLLICIFTFVIMMATHLHSNKFSYNVSGQNLTIYFKWGVRGTLQKSIM